MPAHALTSVGMTWLLHTLADDMGRKNRHDIAAANTHR